MRGSEKIEKIGGYNVEKEVKYLEVWVGGNGRDIFRAEKRLWIKKANKKANQVISQINRKL